MSFDDFYCLAMTSIIAWSIVHVLSIMKTRHKMPEAQPTPRPVDPYFDAEPPSPKPEIVEIVEFQPKFDIDVTFERVVGSVVERRIDEKREAERKKAMVAAKLTPVKQAFEHIINTRKPMVSGKEVLELKWNDWMTEPSVGFFLGGHPNTWCVHIYWSSEKGYHVRRHQLKPISEWRKPNETRVDYFHQDWRQAFDQAIELIAPFIVGYDGKTSLEVTK